MKNIVIAVLIVASITLGAIAYQQANQAAQNRSELKQVQEQLAQVQNQLQATAEATDKAASVERSSKAVQETLVKTSQFAKQKEAEAASLQEKLATAQTNTSNPMAGMAKMFNDPKMRDLIKSQQKMVMGPMIAKQYGALMKQLNMSDEDGGKLKTLLTDKMLAGTDAGMAMMDDSLTPDQRKERSKQVEDTQTEFDGQLKDFLGDKYSDFKKYEKTVPDRMVVSQFGDQLSGDLALSEAQSDQLAQAMSEARTGFKWTTDFSEQKPPADGDYSALFAGDRLDKFAQEKEQFDAQFLDQAKGVLSAGQMKEFASFQKTQRDMQVMSMKMAAQMFGQKK